MRRGRTADAQMSNRTSSTRSGSAPYQAFLRSGSHFSPMAACDGVALTARDKASYNQSVKDSKQNRRFKTCTYSSRFPVWLDICNTLHQAKSRRKYKLKIAVPPVDDTDVGGTFTF